MRRFVFVLFVLALVPRWAVAQPFPARVGATADIKEIAHAALLNRTTNDPNVTLLSMSLWANTSAGQPGRGRLLDAGDLNGDGISDVLALHDVDTLVDLTIDRPPALLPTMTTMEAVSGANGSHLWGPVMVRSDGISELLVETHVTFDADASPDISIFELDFVLEWARVSTISGRTGTTIWSQDTAGAGLGHILGAGMPLPLGSGDIDGDGRTDLLVGSLSGTAVYLSPQQVHANRGAWTLTAATLSGANGVPVGVPQAGIGYGDAPTAAIVGDLDADGRQDIVMTTAIIQSIPVQVTMTAWRGNGSLIWNSTIPAGYTQENYATAIYPRAKVVPGPKDGFLLEFLGSRGVGNGVTSVIVVDSAGKVVSSILDRDGAYVSILGDIDNDGYRDIKITAFVAAYAYPGYDTLRSTAYSGKTNFKTFWTQSQTYWQGYAPPYRYFVDDRVGDIDGDGIADWQTAGFRSGKTGAFLWSPAYTASPGGYAAVRGPIGGVAGDDVLLTEPASGSPNVSVSLADGANGSRLWTSLVPGSPSGDRPSAVAIDVNRDGRLDAVVEITMVSGAAVSSATYAFDGTTGALLWSA